jgi:hypothetical protein
MLTTLNDTHLLYVNTYTLWILIGMEPQLIAQARDAKPAAGKPTATQKITAILTAILMIEIDQDRDRETAAVLPKDVEATLRSTPQEGFRSAKTRPSRPQTTKIPNIPHGTSVA